MAHTENHCFGGHKKQFSSGTHLLTCLLFHSIYIGMSIYYVINARTLSSYVFLWKTRAHTDLNNVGLLQYRDDILSSIMMYMNRLTFTQQRRVCTQHV